MKITRELLGASAVVVGTGVWIFSKTKWGDWFRQIKMVMPSAGDRSQESSESSMRGDVDDGPGKAACPISAH